MRAATPSYLVDKTHLKQKALTLRIPLHVHDGLNAARERADRAGFVFDIQAVVVEALERAVSKVGNELGAVEMGEMGEAGEVGEVSGASRPKATRRRRKSAKVDEVKTAN